MQKTKFSRINDQLNNIIFGFLSSSWKSKSINIISVLIGYFLFANFITKFIIRSRPSYKSSLYYLWSIIDKIRTGATFAIILEAFKLGS